MSDAATADERVPQPGAERGPTSEVTAGRWPRERIELDACLLSGTGDSTRLLLAWFVKKSFWWMFFGGAAFASLVHFVERTDNEFNVSYSSPESVERGLLSAWAPVVLAVLLRLVMGWIGVALAYPLARAHDHGLPARTGWNRQYATLSDRYKVAKAFRNLRWTHYVRQVALDRVAPGRSSWWRRWDPIIDVLNVIGVVAFVIATSTIATIDATELLG